MIVRLVNAHPFNAVRKMACNFGWDWGPDLATAGLWRPVRLHRWSGARLDGVRLLPDVHDGVPTLQVHAGVLLDDAPSLTLAVSVAGQNASAAVDSAGTSLTVPVPDAELWWPIGYGEQPLYDVTVTLLSNDEPIETFTRRVGFRSVELDTTPDGDGTPMTFRINDRPVYVKGANWIPDDCFPSRVDRARYATSIGKAAEMGVNLLRVWGGGIYEDNAFYEICDELGILTWQDFLLACAAYSEDEPLRSEVAAEARENVARLSHHPSLALWNGNNENLWAFEEWGWAEQLAGLSWGAEYYHQVFPGIVAELDPTRPYTPGSPWSPGTGHASNSTDHGSQHIWDVWNELDYTEYRKHRPRFAAEFGYQGPPTWATLTRAIHDDPLSPTSPGMLAHEKADDGIAKLHRGIALHLPVPEDFEDWHWAMQLQQARAVRFGLEHLRSLAPRNSGAVVWQHNDCWPVTSWAAVDGDGRRKPLWYGMRHAYAPRLLTFQPRKQGLVLFAHNDTDQPWQATVRLTRATLAGKPLDSSSVPLDVPARGNQAIPVPATLERAETPEQEYLHATDAEETTGTGNEAFWYFVEDVDLLLADDLSVTARADGSDVVVTVTATTLAKDVTLLVDKVVPDAVADHALQTILPGSSADFRVSHTNGAAPEAFTTVVRSANQLVHQARTTQGATE